MHWSCPAVGQLFAPRVGDLRRRVAALEDEALRLLWPITEFKDFTERPLHNA